MLSVINSGKDNDSFFSFTCKIRNSSAKNPEIHSGVLSLLQLFAIGRNDIFIPVKAFLFLTA